MADLVSRLNDDRHLYNLTWLQSGNVNLISAGVQYALFIIFTSIMFFFVDKIGRRTLLVWGAIAMGFCHFVVGGTLGAHYTYVPGKILPARRFSS